MENTNAMIAAKYIRDGLDNLRTDPSVQNNQVMSTICLAVLRSLTGARFDRPADRAYHYQLMNPDLGFAKQLEHNGVLLNSSIVGDFFEFNVVRAENGHGYTIKLPYNKSIAALINVGTTTVH